MCWKGYYLWSWLRWCWQRHRRGDRRRHEWTRRGHLETFRRGDARRHLRTSVDSGRHNHANTTSIASHFHCAIQHSPWCLSACRRKNRSHGDIDSSSLIVPMYLLRGFCSVLRLGIFFHLGVADCFWISIFKHKTPLSDFVCKTMNVMLWRLFAQQRLVSNWRERTHSFLNTSNFDGTLTTKIVNSDHRSPPKKLKHRIFETGTRPYVLKVRMPSTTSSWTSRRSSESQRSFWPFVSFVCTRP